MQILWLEHRVEPVGDFLGDLGHVIGDMGYVVGGFSDSSPPSLPLCSTRERTQEELLGLSCTEDTTRRVSLRRLLRREPEEP